jgi:hypothetical protein
MRTIAAMLLVVLGQWAVVTPARAGMMCQKKSGAVVVRNACKKHESPVNIGMANGDVGIGTDAPAAALDVNGQTVFRGGVTFDAGVSFDAGQTFPNTATLGANTFTADQTVDGNLVVNGIVASDEILSGKIGIGTSSPSNALSAAGEAPQTFGMERNTTAGAPGNDLTIQAGGSAPGSTDQQGGDLTLAAGVGTGLGAGGNIRLQTAGAASASGTGDDVLVDRHIVVAQPKHLTLAAPGFVSLFSIKLVGTNTAGGRVHFVVRATDGGSQIATQTGTIVYLATANSITCTLASDTLHLGTVNAGCTPGFFNPGSQPGISIFDNVSFSSPAPIVIHEVYYDIENESGSAIRLEP